MDDSHLTIDNELSMVYFRVGLVEANAFNDCMEKLPGPHVDTARILQKRAHLLPGLGDIKAVNRLPQQHQECFRGEPLRGPSIRSAASAAQDGQGVAPDNDSQTRQRRASHAP